MYGQKVHTLLKKMWFLICIPFSQCLIGANFTKLVHPMNKCVGLKLLRYAHRTIKGPCFLEEQILILFSWLFFFYVWTFYSMTERVYFLCVKIATFQVVTCHHCIWTHWCVVPVGWARVPEVAGVVGDPPASRHQAGAVIMASGGINPSGVIRVGLHVTSTMNKYGQMDRVDLGTHWSRLRVYTSCLAKYP